MSRRSKQELFAELVGEIRAGQSAVDQMDAAATTAMGINRTDGRCLDVIDRLEQVSAGDLAIEAGLTTGAVTTVLDRLEAKGYVSRLPDPTDRRRVFVVMTDHAKSVARELWGPMTGVRTGVYDRYTTAEIELLIGFMRRSRELNERRAAEIRAQLCKEK